MSNEFNDMGRYPNPNFSAQDAWKNMQGILDKEMPVQQKRKKRFAFFWITTLLLLGSGIYLLNDTNNASIIEKNIVQYNTNKNVETTTSSLKTSDPNINNSAALNDKKTVVINDKTAFAKLTTVIASTTKKNSFYQSKSTITEDENYTISTPQINILKKIADKQNGVVGLNNIASSVNDFVTTTNASTIIAEDKSTAEILDKKQTEVVKNITTTTTTNKVVKVPKVKLDKGLHYGLQWNILLPQSNSYLDYNAKSQPLSVVIPEFWVSKELNKKSEIALQVNPYSQYTLQSNNVLNSKNYTVSMLQGSNSNQNAIITNYLQTRSLLKAMGVELTAKYTYKINNNLSIAIGVGNNWLNAAVVNDKVVSADGKFSHDTLYGIAKGFNDWNYLKSSFVVGRFELLYKFNKIEAGVAFVKPLGNIYSFNNSNTNRVNARVVLRWKIK